MFNTLFEDQKKNVKEELDIYLKYDLVSKTIYDKTIDQYNQYFFYKDYAYPANLVKDFIIRDHLSQTTYLKQKPQQPTPPQPKPTPQPTPQPTPPQPTPQSPTQPQTYEINRQAIRNITGYTHEPIPTWSSKAPYNTPKYQKPTTIQWQLDLLEDDADVIVVDGSRQM